MGLETEISCLELTVESTVEPNKTGHTKAQVSVPGCNTSITLLQVIAKRIVLSMSSLERTNGSYNSLDTLS